MVSICKDCGQQFLSSSEYKRHQQTHIDSWCSNIKPDNVSWKPPEGMNHDLVHLDVLRRSLHFLNDFIGSIDPVIPFQYEPQD